MDAALKAAAEALRNTGTHYNSILHADRVASIAVEAAREVIAQEIEAERSVAFSVGDGSGWSHAITRCARIARGPVPRESKG